MKSRPRRLLYSALFLALLAAAMPGQIMILYGHAPNEVSAILAKLAPMNWVVMLLSAATAIFAHRASRGLVIAAPALGLAVAYNNYLVARVGQDFSANGVLLSTVFFLTFLCWFFSKDVRELIADPRRRWWLTPRRWKADIPIRLQVLPINAVRGWMRGGFGPKEFKSSTFDISEEGAFIRMDGLTKPIPGMQCYLCLTIKDLCFVQCRAEVVRTSNGSRGNYPGGIAVKFLGLSGNDRRMLMDYIRDLSRRPALAA